MTTPNVVDFARQILEMQRQIQFQASELERLSACECEYHDLIEMIALLDGKIPRSTISTIKSKYRAMQTLKEWDQRGSPAEIHIMFD